MVGSSGSDGFIERGLQAAECQGRTIKLAFESHTGDKAHSDHDVIPWMIEYVAVLFNRCQVGEEGKTSYERLKGNASSIPALELGEHVLWRSSAWT